MADLPSHLYIGRVCKRGHEHEGTGGSLRTRSTRSCRECNRLHQAKRRLDPAVRDQGKIDSKLWHQEHKDDPGRKAAAVKRAQAWAAANPDRHRERMRRYVRERRASDPQFDMACRIRRRVRVALRSAATGRPMRTSKYGVDWQAVVDHLGPKPGPGYEVDHITPLTAFDLTDSAQVRAACRPENHQWLTISENRSKGGA